jgi:hypothetical protein
MAVILLFSLNGPHAILGVFLRESDRVGTDRLPTVDQYPTWVIFLALAMGLGATGGGLFLLSKGIEGVVFGHALELAAAGLFLAGSAGIGLYRRVCRAP